MSGSSAGCEEDVMRIKKKLDKMMKTNEIDANVSIDMLNALKKLPIDLHILKNTGIGVVLNNLRKSCNSEDLGTVAKSLLKCWKKLLAGENSQSISSPNSNNNDNSNSQMSPTITSSNSIKRTLSSSSPDTATLTSNGKHARTEEAKPAAPATNGSSPAAKPANGTGNEAKKFNPLLRHISFTHTKDPIRLKCREMLANALELTEPIENGSALCDVNEIAARCEDVIYAEFNNTDSKYKNRIRSRVINLKDSKNPKFRESVRLGIITPDRLAVIPADEMASEELKNLRAKFTKESIDDHQMARTQGAKTSLLTCSKCKKNNCSYSEMQTRSADEPMTTFAYCLECGHRWKFG